MGCCFSSKVFKDDIDMYLSKFDSPEYLLKQYGIKRLYSSKLSKSENSKNQIHTATTTGKEEEKEEVNQFILAMAHAFSGSKISQPELATYWTLTNIVHPDGQPLENDPEEKVLNFNKWFFKFMVEMTWEIHGRIYMKVDPKTNQCMSGSIVVFNINNKSPKKYNHLQDMSMFQFFRLSLKYGFPPIYNDKMELMEKKMKALHQKRFPNHERHIYLYCIGTEPTFQGKGHGKSHMLLLNDMADSLQVDIYLETAGLKNETYYKKFGYQIIEKEILKTKTSSFDDGNGGFMAMIRKPKKKN